MRIIRLAKSFTDMEKWILHGVDPAACRKEFKDKHAQREVQRKEAEERASKLGHRLGPWGYMNISRCRKCGMTCQISNIDGQYQKATDGGGFESHIGGALSQKCPSNLDVPEDYWNLSDHFHKETYKDQDDTVI